MKKIILSLVLCLILVLTVSLALVDAAAYMKFDGIDGESKDQQHDKWSDIMSFNHGIHIPGGGATGATRRRGGAVSDIIVRKAIDKASVKIQEEMLKGTVFPLVEIHEAKLTPNGLDTVYYKYELRNARVTNYYIGDARRKTEELQPIDSEIPLEEIKLEFEEMKVSYLEIDEHGDPHGWIEYVWDFVRDMLR